MVYVPNPSFPEAVHNYFPCVNKRSNEMVLVLQVKVMLLCLAKLLSYNIFSVLIMTFEYSEDQIMKVLNFHFVKFSGMKMLLILHKRGT